LVGDGGFGAALARSRRRDRALTDNRRGAGEARAGSGRLGRTLGDYHRLAATHRAHLAGAEGAHVPFEEHDALAVRALALQLSQAVGTDEEIALHALLAVGAGQPALDVLQQRLF